MAAATARQIPVVNNVITDEDFEKLRTEGKHSGKLVPVSVLKTHKLLTDKHSKELVDRHVRAIHRLTKYFCHGFLMKDVDLVCDMITVCRERLEIDVQYQKPLCDLIKVCGKPFLKERTSDDSTHADSIINLLTELGHTMKINNITVQLQLGESLIRFYTEQPSESQGLMEGKISQAMHHDQLEQHTLCNVQIVDIAAAVENFRDNLSLLELARAANKF